MVPYNLTYNTLILLYGLLTFNLYDIQSQIHLIKNKQTYKIILYDNLIL